MWPKITTPAACWHCKDYISGLTPRSAHVQYSRIASVIIIHETLKYLFKSRKGDFQNKSTITTTWLLFQFYGLLEILKSNPLTHANSLFKNVKKFNIGSLNLYQKMHSPPKLQDWIMTEEDQQHFLSVIQKRNLRLLSFFLHKLISKQRCGDYKRWYIFTSRQKTDGSACMFIWRAVLLPPTVVRCSLWLPRQQGSSQYQSHEIFPCKFEINVHKCWFESLFFILQVVFDISLCNHSCLFLYILF